MVICHQAVMRCLLAYFQDKSAGLYLLLQVYYFFFQVWNFVDVVVLFSLSSIQHKKRNLYKGWNTYTLVYKVNLFMVVFIGVSV